MEEKMGKGQACFDCRNCDDKRSHTDRIGWRHYCKLGMSNSKMNGGIEQVLDCPNGQPRLGFQMGGYYTHMWFEPYYIETDNGPGFCLNWIIKGDGEFPRDEPELQFHICDFTQIEAWVKFWGKELRKNGFIEEEKEDDQK